VNEDSISINKFVSSKGLCSRREADKWIDAGRVTINGQRAKKGNRVVSGDEVVVDGEVLQNNPEPVYLALHKPIGITCTTDKKDKDNIIDFLAYPQRVFPVGRLDKASSGLILITNDGDIVNKILRVEHNHEKEYIVKVNKAITEKFLKKMANGVPILDTLTNKCQIEQLSNDTFNIVLTQGLNRQIRRMCEYFDYEVLALKRIRIMHILLGKMKVGQLRELNKSELRQLKNITGQ